MVDLVHTAAASPVRRPVPVPSAETRPFWDAAALGELRLPRCPACDRLHYPPPPRCPHCLKSTLRWERVAGDATVRSWTVAHLATIPGVTPPFTIVEGELRAQSDLVIVALAADDLAGALALDQHIALVFKPDRDGVTFPVFRMQPQTGKSPAPIEGCA